MKESVIVLTAHTNTLALLYDPAVLPAAATTPQHQHNSPLPNRSTLPLRPSSTIVTKKPSQKPTRHPPTHSRRTSPPTQHTPLLKHTPLLNSAATSATGSLSSRTIPTPLSATHHLKSPTAISTTRSTRAALWFTEMWRNRAGLELIMKLRIPQWTLLLCGLSCKSNFTEQ